MAIISGVVKKGEGPVEGAKVYILYDGEVVASAETNADGEYLCDGLDDDKKYHAVVEHEEVDGEEVTLYSARSMPGITPAEDPRLFLYKDGEGGENWDGDGEKFVKYDTYMHLKTFPSDTGGGYDARIWSISKVDLTDVNYIKLTCECGESGNDFGVSDSTHASFVSSTKFDEVDEDGVVSLDVSSLTGEYHIVVRINYWDDNYLSHLYVYRVWLE